MNAATVQPIAVAPDLPRRTVALRLAQLRAVFGLSSRIALRGKRLWILALLGILPTLLPILHIVASRLSSRVPPFPPAMEFFKTVVVSTVYLRVILYILALAYGLAIISDEVESKTLVHLLLRPLPRWVIVLGRFLSTWLIAGLLLAGSLALNYVLIWAAQREAGAWKNLFSYANLRILLLDALVFFLALAAYLALFSCIGAWLRHGERWGVVFCFGWEWLIPYLPSKLKWFTVMYQVQTLFPHDVSVAKFFSLWGERFSKTACIAILLIAAAAFLALTVINLKRREIR